MRNLLKKNELGQSLIELLIVIGLASIMLPAVFVAVMSSQEGRIQQRSRMQALSLLREAQDATRSFRDNDWKTFAVNGTYHPALSNNAWILSQGQETINNLYTRTVVISDAYRDLNGVATTSGTLDQSTKLVTITVSWTNTFPSSVQSQMYLTRHDNLAYIQTTLADFNAGVLFQSQTTNNFGGEVILGNNNKAKWCSPAFSSATIDLPDGPPVAVAATASAVTNSIPNDVFVATAPFATSSVKMAYLNVSADTDPPIATLEGTFTMDPTKYSTGTFPSGTGVNNSFRTNDIKYYKSSGGKLYGLLATDNPSKEVIVVQINNGSSPSFQDPVNKIYKYWTFFNTIPYYGAAASNDQAPYGYGAVSMTILGSTGYIDSGGYLYAFDLSNIDSKTPTTGLDMVGCRIELDGYDCQPGNPGHDSKYIAGNNPIQTNTTWGDTASPANNNCSDGGNIELYADHQLSGVQVGNNKYIYVAVGAGTNPELDIINVSTLPTNNTNPKINNRYCGIISSANNPNSGWRQSSSLDFDPYSGTEEAANSVYAKTDGTRAYVSSNGGIVHNGIPDSDQFYIIDTSNKSSPKFLTTWASNGGSPAPGHHASTASSGYYNGDSTNIELYPRRALTVLNGQRAVLVGQDGIPNNGVEPKEYQVLNLDNESTPTFCNGLNFLAGFNDLTSVTEANNDSYVYMVANTMEHQLRIIQGGPDTGIYIGAGQISSKSFDATKAIAFNSFYANVTKSLPTTNIQFQVAVGGDDNANCATYNYKFIGPDGSEGTKFATTSAAIPLSSSVQGYQNPGKCFRYKAYFSTQDTNQTPVLNDFTVNYSP